MAERTRPQWLEVVVLTLWSCSGGQSGDSGDPIDLGGQDTQVAGDGCCRYTSESASLTEALDFDTELRTAFEAEFGDATERSYELVLVGPTELWTSRGRQPPADHSTRATLTFQVTGAAERFHAEEVSECGSFSCESYAKISLDVLLELPELGATLRTETTFGEDGADPLLWEELGSCVWSPDATLSCNTLTYANTSCLDEGAWREPPATEPRSGLSLQELLDTAAAPQLRPLQCSAEQQPTANLRVVQVIVPERYCPSSPDSESVPVTVIAEGAEGQQSIAARLHLSEETPCFLTECSEPQPCEVDFSPVPEENMDVRMCSQLTATWDIGETFRVQVNDEQTVVVGQSHSFWSDPPDSGYTSCWTQAVVE